MRLLLLLLLLPIATLCQKRDSVFVKTQIYDVMYSEKLEQPLWVKYTVKCSVGNYTRTGIKFYKNDSIHTSDDLDYQNNTWDKGHLAPAADFNCDSQMLLITFSYLNCALQDQDLNRGVWKNLEVFERKLSKTKSVEVRVICQFSDESKKLPTGATVPDGFWKIITYSGKTMKFYFPNKSPKSTDYMKYLVK